MTLFDSESQYREKTTQWRVFSLAPLFAGLTGGKSWRWFAVNIPMQLAGDDAFTSDLDIVACLNDFPDSHGWIFRTWEVKVSLLRKDGKASSLKAGKLPKTLNQLRAYRRFGSPAVSLLDAYVCQAGFFSNNPFPPPSIIATIPEKVDALAREGFGYEVLPFEHGEEAGADVGLSAIGNPLNPFYASIPILQRSVTEPTGPFLKLTILLNNFVESGTGLGDMRQIVYCRSCRALQRVLMSEEEVCPTCGADLIAQT
jgi:hypothetical protein